MTYIHSTFFANQKVRFKNKIFEERVAPVLAEAVVDRLRFTAITQAGVRIPLSVDTTLVSTYSRDAHLMVTVRPTGPVSLRRDLIEFIEISTGVDLSQSENSKIIVRSATFRYSTQHLNGYLAQDFRIDNDLKPGDPVTIYTPLSAEEKRNPREEDKQFSRKLIDHLNANLEYYHKAIWRNMDPDRRYMLLDGFIAPNSGGRSVASVVENRVIGVAGNCLIMPVAPGYKLDPTYVYEPLLDDEGEPVRDESGNILYKTTDLLEHYQPRTPIPPFRISVPTRGVFAEAVQGACNSCERIERDRFWQWEESPIPDSPTQIAPIQTSPPQRSDPGNLEPTPLPAPIVNIQNAPAAPEPGAALAGALSLLGKGDLFRDITGLDQTQKNALQAMLSNQESAKHFADKAAEMAIQASNLKSGDTTIDGIKRAMDDDLLDQATGKKLIEDVFRSQINGGKPGPESNTASTSELASAGAEAVRQGRQVRASQTHPDGTQTSVEQEIETEPSEPQPETEGQMSFDYTVPGTISVLAQPNTMSCWATVGTMMVSWKTQTSIVDIKTVAEQAGPKFVAALENNTGLGRDDKLEFVQKLGMVPDEGNFQSHGYEFYLDLLQQFGPLWLTVDTSDTELALHAKILYGMRGDGSPDGTSMRIIDPNGGRRYEVTFQQFLDEYESVPREMPPGEDLFIQIVRFADPLNRGPVEGAATKVKAFGGPYALATTSQAALQTALSQAVTDVAASGALGSNPKLAISIIGVAATGSHVYAGVDDDLMHYSASLLKVAALFSAHQLLDRASALARTDLFPDKTALFKRFSAEFDPQIAGRALASVKAVGIGLAPKYSEIFTATGFTGLGGPTVDFSASFKKKLEGMINGNSNADAGSVIRALGYSYINASLMEAGFYDAGTNRGIWLAGDYSGGSTKYARVPSVNDGDVAQATTTRQMCRLFALMDTSKLIDAKQSVAMFNMLGINGAWLNGAANRKFQVEAAKVGVGPLKSGISVYSEGEIVSWNGAAGDAAKLAAKNLTGRFAVVWQNLRNQGLQSEPKKFEGVAEVINRAVTGLL